MTNSIMRVKATKGGLSGGTVASMATIFSEIWEDKHKAKMLKNPYLLNDDENPSTIRQTSLKIPTLEEDGERWLAPFVMDDINTKIVHRSNQRLDYRYVRDFKYDEATLMLEGVKGQLMSYEPSRKLLNEHILPESGDGPSKAERDNGYFDIRFDGLIGGELQIQSKVMGSRDPGYGSTCCMLAQSALCLLQDVSKNEVGGGFWTPASAMGNKLIDRLQTHASIGFEVLSIECNLDNELM